MDTQDHEYELGTLEAAILDRDESDVRQNGNRGDERRWMILGGAGTLALLAALVAAVSLGGATEAHDLSASLRGPVRDLAALSAHLQSQSTGQPTAAAAPQKPKARIARGPAKPAAPQPAVNTAAPTAKPSSAPASHAAAADTAGGFADLPTVSAAADDDDDAAAEGDGLDPAEVVPTNFEQDDDPFAADPSEPEDEPASEDDADDADDAVADPEAAPESEAEASAPAAPAPAAAGDDTVTDVAAPPTPASAI